MSTSSFGREWRIKVGGRYLPFIVSSSHDLCGGTGRVGGLKNSKKKEKDEELFLKKMNLYDEIISKVKNPK